MVISEKPHLIFLRLWENLSTKRKFQAFLLIILMIISSFADLISLGSVIPLTSLIIEPDLLINNNYYPFLANLLKIESSENIVNVIVLLFILTAFLAALFKMLYLWFSLRLSGNIGNDLSYKAFLNTIYQPYSTQLNWNTSKLITSIEAKTNMTVIALHQTFLMIASIFLAVLLSVFLLVTHPYLSLICLAVFTFSYLILSVVTKSRLYRNGLIISNNVEKRHKIHQESLGAIRDVILDGPYRMYASNYRKIDRSIRLSDAENNFISSSPRSIIEFVGLVFIALLSYFLTTRSTGQASVLPFLAALTLGIQKFLPAIQQIYNGYSQLIAFYEAILGVLGFLEMKRPIESINHKNIKPFDFQQLNLKNINYSYQSSKTNTLSEINLKINKGDRVGIVGPSGCGKTTLMDILLGLIEPSSGIIEVNDKYNLYSSNKNNLILYKWRKSVAHVPQFIFLIDSDIFS